MAAVGGLGIPSCCAGLNIFESLLLSERFLAASSLFFPGRKERQAVINGVWVRITQQTAEGAAERSVPDSLKVGKSGKSPLGCQLVALSHRPQCFSLGVRAKQEEAEQKGRGFHAGAFHPSQISPCPCSSGCREHRWKLSQWKNPRAWQEQLMWFAGGLISLIFRSQSRAGSCQMPRTKPSVACRLQERRGCRRRYFPSV